KADVADLELGDDSGSDGAEDLRQLVQGARIERGRGRTDARRPDPAAPSENLLADADGRARGRAGLTLVADERQPAVEERPRVVTPAGHESVANGLERLRVGEPRHGPVGAPRELFEEVDAAQPAEDSHAPAE